MKLFLIVVLYFCTCNLHAVEFYQCVDDKGHQHFTNLPRSTLDNNCRPKTDQYAYMLNQDYLTIESQYKQYYEPEPSLDESTNTEQANSDEDILDADNALNQLLERSKEQQDNKATEFFNAHSKAVEEVLSEGNSNTPPVLP